MKTNIAILWYLTAYFVVVGGAYILWNWLATERIEWAGSTAILLSAGLTGMIAFYLGLVQRKQGGDLVEDRLDSDIDDGDPEIGMFSPWSWWPFNLAAGLALFAIGMATGHLHLWFWLALFALPIVIIGIVGWVFEHYRGDFAR